MSTPPSIEKKIADGMVKHGKDVAGNAGQIGKEVFKASKEISKNVLKVGEATLQTGIAVGKGVYGVSKAAVKTGVAVGKTAAAAAYFPIKRRRSILDFFWKRKKGIITGAADNDPSGIVTYTQTGAATGYQLLWLALLAWPLLVAVENMSARIGIVTKKGVNRNIAENYGIFWAWLAMIIVSVCNTFTVGADIAAMADVSSILSGLPAFFYVVVFGLLFVYLLWKKGYAAVSRYLFIVTPVFLLYIISAFLFNVPWGEALRSTFIPMIKTTGNSFYMIAVAFLGTTLSPYLVFWETTQEIEESRSITDVKKENSSVAVGMFFTQFITFFIVIAAAAAFAGNNQLIGTAKDAALALKPIGIASFLLYSLGILGAGLIAIPVLAATTGYTVAETLNYRAGLSKSFSRAKGFYTIIFISLIIGVVISLSGLNPIRMLVYSQVLNGILMPILTLFLLFLCNNKKIMGGNTNGSWINFWGVLALVVNIGFVMMMFINWLR